MFNSYSKEQFIQAVQNSYSIRQILSTLNVRPHGGNYRTAQKYIQKLNLDISHFKGQGWNKGNRLSPKRPIEDYLNNTQTIASNKLKQRLINEGIKQHQCEHCGLTIWENKPIPLELHHIDGNHLNNNIDNLEILCPNCHHQTPNFRNTKSKRIHSAGELNGYTRPKKQYFCSCGKTKSRSSLKCKSCAATIHNSKYKKRPDINQLKKDIIEFNDNKSAIARKYNVSQTAIRKWCEIYQIK